MAKVIYNKYIPFKGCTPSMDIGVWTATKVKSLPSMTITGMP